MNRSRLIITASFAASLGWGTILPFQYAYVVDARGWGSVTGVLTGTVFCVGSVVAAPTAGRLADRYPARALAVVFALLAALSCIGLGVASSPATFLAAMAMFGAAVTASAPATQLLLLECSGPDDRRSVFAYQFTAMALGMAVGAFAAGWVIDLDRPEGMWPAFTAATLGFAASAWLIFVSNGTEPTTARQRLDDSRHHETVPSSAGGPATYRALFANRQVRLLALVSMALAAGFYAQFETGLPAFALQSLSVQASTIGVAAAANCLVIVGLQWLVVRLTRHHSGALLLVMVGAIWAGCWLVLDAALFLSPEHASVVFVIAFGVFAVGETMYAPVLSPLAAAVAPPGMVGTTLGALAALRTGISAAGPLVAGLLIALDLPHVFVLSHAAINVTAAVLAWRLLLAQGRTQRPSQVDNGHTLDARSIHV
ncbi:MAG: MFS transporter [Nocardioidaceae bacterium]